MHTIMALPLLHPNSENLLFLGMNCNTRTLVNCHESSVRDTNHHHVFSQVCMPECMYVVYFIFLVRLICGRVLIIFLRVSCDKDFTHTPPSSLIIYFLEKRGTGTFTCLCLDARVRSFFTEPSQLAEYNITGDIPYREARRMLSKPKCGVG
jgi:hypothetical protein